MVLAFYHHDVTSGTVTVKFPCTIEKDLNHTIRHIMCVHTSNKT